MLYAKFPVFFHWKEIYNNAYKGLHKSTKNRNYLYNVNLEFQSPLSLFLRENIIFDFFFFFFFFLVEG